MRKSLITAIAVITCAMVSIPTAMAGDRDHQGGFFLRLSGGIGAAETKIDDGTSTLKISGGAGDFNFAIGGMVANQLALHGTIWGWAVVNPELSGIVSGTVEARLNMTAVGVGITYYFMPANIYLSGSVGGGALSVDAGTLEGRTDAGPVVDITLGKEWWVGNRWGLGIALGGGFHNIKNGGSGASADNKWKGGNFTVRFTATYN